MNNDSTKNINPNIKGFISGGCIIGEMILGGLFMENLKQRTSKPYYSLASNTLKQGIRGFEAGLLPWGVAIGFTKGTVLGWSHSYIKNICYRKDISSNTTAYISGFGSGAVQGAFISPLMLARTRINESITQRGLNNQIKTGWKNDLKMSSGILYSVVKNEGITSLFKGMPVMIARRSIDWGLRFSIKNSLDLQLKLYKSSSAKGRSQLNNYEKLATSFASGVISSAFTMPLDRMIPIMQSSSKDGIIKTMKTNLANEGFGTLFRGYGMRSIHTGWHTTFAIFVADYVYDVINKE